MTDYYLLQKLFSSLNRNRLISKMSISSVSPKQMLLETARKGLDMHLNGLNADLDVSETDSPGNTSLIFAAANGHLKNCQILVEAGAVIDQVNEYGNSACACACRKDSNGDVVEMLVRIGANVNMRNNYGRTPLITAVSSAKSPEICRILLKNGANVDLSDEDGNSPLIFAARKGFTECISVLIEYGADLNKRNIRLETPLIESARDGRIDAVELLLLLGADVTHTDKRGKCALMRAAEEGYNQICKLLLESGADVNRLNEMGHTALTIAARNGHFDTCSILIELGEANINQENQLGANPLYFAVKSGCIDTCKVLIDHGSQVVKKVLMEASRTGNVLILDILMQSHPLVDLNEMLCTAAAHGRARMCDFLITMGGIINTKIHGTFPIILAAEKGHYKTVAILVEKHHGNVNVENNDGNTALIAAAHVRGSLGIGIIKLLVRHGVNINAQNNHGNTAIMESVEHLGLDTCKLLVESGADVNIKNMHGVTALMIAAERNLLDFVTFFLSVGADPTFRANSKTALDKTSQKEAVKILNDSIRFHRSTLFMQTISYFRINAMEFEKEFVEQMPVHIFDAYFANTVWKV